MNYFQVNVKYDRQTGEDNPGRVKEAYLVNATTCSEAEKVVLDEIKPFVFGECETPKIQKKEFFDFLMDSPGGHIFYEGKVELITVEGEKEYRKAVNILVSSISINDALYTLIYNLSGYDYEVIGIKKTGITDVLIAEKSE